MGRRTVRTSHKPDSVKALIARAVPALTRVSEQTARQGALRGWLEARLPAPALAHLSGIVHRPDGTLVVFTESAAWCARVRYAVGELESELKEAHPEVERIAVRVLPRPGGL